jgi:hypothetical protein
MTSSQAQFQLANSFGIAEARSCHGVVFPSKREAFFWRAESSAQHIVKGVEIGSFMGSSLLRIRNS